jgi:hypothetical protein
MGVTVFFYSMAPLTLPQIYVNDRVKWTIKSLNIMSLNVSFLIFDLLDDASLWTMRPLVKTSLGRCVF